MTKQPAPKIDELSASFIKMIEKMTGKTVTLVDTVIEIERGEVEKAPSYANYHTIDFKMVGTDKPTEEASISSLCSAITKQSIKYVKQFLSKDHVQKGMLTIPFTIGDEKHPPALLARIFVRNASTDHERNVANEILDLVTNAIAIYCDNPNRYKEEAYA